MHVYTNKLLILVLTLLSITKCVSCSDDSDARNRAVLLGYGYSTDSEQVTYQACFNATVRKISDQTMRIELSSAVSTSELQRTFGADLSVQASYGTFDSGAKASYLRSIQEDESSVSINYYVVYQETVTVEMGGLYDEALTDYGKKVYHQANQHFGLQCGDSYIASYNQGAVLSVGLNIKLNSKKDKETLKGNMRASYGSFGNIAAKIQSVSNENKISGTVQIRAYQFGGDPTELLSIMSKNIADCDIRNMSGCKMVINELLAYANDFESQIKNGSTLEALNSFVLVSVNQLGLEVPTLVTPTVLKYREDLANKLKENQYYARKLLSLSKNEYPVKLEGELSERAKSLYDNATHNIDLIMNPVKGAARCFNTPDKCKDIKTRIYNNLKNITSHDLFVLERDITVYVRIQLKNELQRSYNSNGI